MVRSSVLWLLGVILLTAAFLFWKLRLTVHKDQVLRRVQEVFQAVWVLSGLYLLYRGLPEGLANALCVVVVVIGSMIIGSAIGNLLAHGEKFDAGERWYTIVGIIGTVATIFLSKGGPFLLWLLLLVVPAVLAFVTDLLTTERAQPSTSRARNA